MAKNRPTTDPRGHSLRIYKDIYTSAAFKALSPVDVMAYLALLAELKQFNNGDVSLPLTRAKTCGIGHHITLARSLRALCAVGLVALARKGGSTKGGQRLPNLYRLTDRDCYEIPKLHLEALSTTNEWKHITTVAQGRQRIQAAEDAIKKETAKLKSLGHPVTTIRTRRDVIKPDIRTPGDTWKEGLGHGETMTENPAKPLSMRVSSTSGPAPEKQSHRTPTRPPLYVAIPTGETALSATVPPIATTTAQTPVNDDDIDGGQIERVHERDLDPALYDSTTGEYFAASTVPARQQKRAADRWVKSELATTSRSPLLDHPNQSTQGT